MPFKKLLSCKSALEPLAWWKQAFGRDFPTVRPFLIPCIGKRADFYPCPDDPNVRMIVRESCGRYRAVPTSDNADDFDDLSLEWEDVQIYRLDVMNFTDHLRDHFDLKIRISKSLENLHPVGHCPVGDRSVYASLHPDSAKNLMIAAGLQGPDTAGCLIFPERIDHVESLMRDRGIASIFLDEAYSCKSPSCGRKCVGLKSALSRQIDDLRRERIEDLMQTQTHRQVIAEMAEGPDKFLAGLRAQLSVKESELFMLLIHREPDQYGNLRPLSYAEIGERLGNISKQAIAARYKKMEQNHLKVWMFVESVRETKSEIAFSGLSPSERRKEGIDESYNYDAG